MTGVPDASAFPVRVRVPDGGWLSVVRGLFPPDRLSVEVGGADGPSGEPGARELVLESDEGGYRLRAGPGIAGEPPGEPFQDPGAAVSALELALTRTLLEAHADRVHLHAAGARLGPTGVLALGTAGAGKSSLALAWSRSGRPLLGDDVVLVDEEGAARAFPRLMKVDAERLAAHGIRPEATHAWVPGWEEAWVDPREGGGWCLQPCPVGLVVLLDRDERGDGGGFRAVEMDGVVALKALLDSALPGGLEGADAVEPLGRLLDGCRCLRLSYRSSREAARFLDREAGDDSGGAEGETNHDR